MRFLESQQPAHACRALALELVFNASWASIPLDLIDIFTEADEGLVLTPIGGVFADRSSETSLRRSL
jgi:hypothetical protein